MNQLDVYELVRKIFRGTINVGTSCLPIWFQAKAAKFPVPYLLKC